MWRFIVVGVFLLLNMNVWCGCFNCRDWQANTNLDSKWLEFWPETFQTVTTSTNNHNNLSYHQVILWSSHHSLHHSTGHLALEFHCSIFVNKACIQAVMSINFYANWSDDIIDFCQNEIDACLNKCFKIQVKLHPSETNKHQVQKKIFEWKNTCSQIVRNNS